jgi:diguanylate cyclase (GGDEF)-like protein
MLDEASNISGILNEVQQKLADTSYSSVLFHIYSSGNSDESILKLQRDIKDVFPNAYICGTSCNGGICNGELVEKGVVLAVSVFEDTRIETHLIKCEKNGEAIVGNRIKQIINDSPNIKAAEIIITLKSINSHTILNIVETCKEIVPIFGGGSADFDISGTDTTAIIDTSISHEGVALITYSGNDLIVDIHHAIGWKPLGKEFLATKIEGKRLYELNDIPAGDVYRNYLDIQADDDFFSNILEFPIMSHQHGIEVLRMPFSCSNEDKSILLAADIDKGTPVHLSYGDPQVIQEDVTKLKNIVKDFSPEAIFLTSCGVRRLYWKYLINDETSPFAEIAPVAGFYSSGEIMRMDNYLIEHHVTLIAISMREGKCVASKPAENTLKAEPKTDNEIIHSQMSIVKRLANFINVTSAELQAANEQLQEIADTDALTGLYNRRMLDRLVHDALKRANKYHIEMTMGIIDIDDFKKINDNYGHDIGDKVLKEISQNMAFEVDKLPSAIFGRWGGEEFLVLAPTLNAKQIFSNIETARKRVSSLNIPPVGVVTLSLGVTSFCPGDDYESFFKRADDALYEAKTTGKNKSCLIL